MCVWGGYTNFTGSKPSPLASAIVRKLNPHEGFLIHGLINTGNKQITNKVYDELKIIFVVLRPR